MKKKLVNFIKANKRELLFLTLILLFAFMFLFNLKHVLVFEEPERTIGDIKDVARMIADDVDETKTFNLMSNYRNPDRWDHNAVGYRYFTEAYYSKRALD